MSLFGSLMGDFDDDIFGNHMNAMNMQMRSMNRLMNSFMPDPFNMLNNFDGGFQQNALMERQNPHPMGGGLFGFPAMPNMNRLLSADIGNNGAAFCSSSVITMSSGPDGRPQIYQATSSTKTGPGGIRETRRTVQDSVNGVKKMAIGHHIGERAHIIEKEQDLRSGQLEEHQEFINLEEDEAEDFDREFITKAHGATGRGGARAICAAPVPQQALTIEEIVDDDDDDDIIETVPHVQRPSSSSSQHRRHMPAIPAPPQPPSSSTQMHQNSSTSAKLTTSATNSATKMSPSSSSTSSNGSSALYTTSVRPSATTNTSSATTTTANSGTNTPYVTTTPRRSTYRGNHHITGASARRPLRTPPSSPLATTPTIHSHGTTSTPSVHPHPYNTSAARRSHHHHHNHHHNQHRSKQHAAKQQTTTTSTANANNQTTANSSQKPKEQDNNSNSK